jgi:hypothetical protein
MKHFLIVLFLSVAMFGGNMVAQSRSGAESFGNTLNLGLGIGYYGYVGRTSPAVHANYEFNVVPSFTLAPFITVYSYEKTHKGYYYRQTVIPIGVKGTYYFDRLLNAGSRWDFYVAGSAGFTLRTTRWDEGYTGDRNLVYPFGGIYLDAHLGVEYHASQKLGIFLDLSTGLSTLGLAIHF